MDNYKDQEDYVIDSDTSDVLDDDKELVVWLKHIRIRNHLYLHDKAFKTRNWNLIVYPDSAPEDWIRQLVEYFHVPFCVSPLHDKDVNPTGEIKKPHYHVTICFDGPKSWLNVVKITKWLNCAVPVDTISLSGSIRYMAHLDNPEKYQYDSSLICGYCGFDVEDCFAPSSGERARFIADMICYINTNEICDLNEFLIYCIQEHYNDWYRVVISPGATIIKDSIKQIAKRIDNELKAAR